MSIRRNITLLLLIILFIGCCNKDKKNMVPLEQIKSDNSTNYRYIFRDIIKKQRMTEERYKKDPFKE